MISNKNLKKESPIGKKILKGTFFVALSTYIVYLITFIRSIILARLLMPEYFGVVALATFFYAFFSQFKEFGLDYALIHKQDRQELSYSTHFMLQTILGIANIVVVLIAIPILSKFYDHRIIKILLIFVVFSIFQAMSSTQRVYLEKQLAFGKIATINIITALIRTIIPILMAITGFGLWSLVWLTILDMLIPFMGYWIIHPWKLSLNFDKQMAKWFFKFGFFLWLGGITSLFMFDFDKFLIGSFAGLINLGFYSKAFEFARLPVSMAGHVLSRVTLPAYSKLQSNIKALSLTFSTVLSFIFRIVLIPALFIVLAAPEFVKLFLGEKWMEMIVILQILAGFTVLRSIYDEACTLFIAMGRPNISTMTNFIQALIMLILGPISIYIIGIKGMAIVVNFMLIIGILVIFNYISKHLNVSYKSIFVVPILSICAAFLCINFLEPYLKTNLGLKLIIKLSLGFLIYAIFLFIFEQKNLAEKIKFIKDLWSEKVDLIEDYHSGF